MRTHSSCSKTCKRATGLSKLVCVQQRAHVVLWISHVF